MLVPVRVEGDGIIGDTTEEIKIGDSEYDRWLAEYEREQELEKQEREAVAKMEKSSR